MARVPIEENTYLTLVKLNGEAKANRSTLLETIKEVSEGWMRQFGPSGFFTIAHVALIGPYDFAMLYTGSTESAIYLAARIGERRVGEIVTMPAIDLDTFTRMLSE
jgi:hypothetical protein